MLRRILPIMLLLLAGCIDPVDIKDDEQSKHLVVEGSFTNDPEYNYVRLTYSLPYSVHHKEYERKAEVSVSSIEGEVYPFYYDSLSGNYLPSAGSAAYGIPGHSYRVNIAIGDSVYQSWPVTMKVPVPIDTIHFEIDEQMYAFKGDREKTRYPGYRVLVDYQDPAGEKTFLRWSFETEYEVFTQPWDFKNEAGIPVPKQCCHQCLLTEKLDRFKVVDDRLTDGSKVINQEVLFIPFYRYFGVKHKLKVYQYAITEEAYNFFRILEQQKENTGTVFDPPPARVRGNLFNIRDKEEQVIGFFNVAAVTMKQATVVREDIDHGFLPFKFPDDCRELPNATSKMPEDW